MCYSLLNYCIKDKSDVELDASRCFTCGAAGHWTRDCCKQFMNLNALLFQADCCSHCGIPMHVLGLAHLHAEGAGQFCKLSKVLLHVSKPCCYNSLYNFFSTHKGLFKKAESFGKEPYNFLQDILGKGAILQQQFCRFIMFCVSHQASDATCPSPKLQENSSKHTLTFLLKVLFYLLKFKRPTTA